MSSPTHTFTPNPALTINLVVGVPWNPTFTYYYAPDTSYTTTTDSVAFAPGVLGTPLNNGASIIPGVTIVGPPGTSEVVGGIDLELSLSASGTPTSAGTYEVYVRGKGSSSLNGGPDIQETVTRKYTVVVSGPSLTLTPSGGAVQTVENTNPVRGSDFVSRPFTIAKGSGSYTVQLLGDWSGSGSDTSGPGSSTVRVGVSASGTVPSTLSNSISITGNTFYVVSPMGLEIPLGTYNQSIKITDNSGGASITISGYTFTVSAGSGGLGILNPVNLPVSYTQLTNGSYTFTAEGGSGTYNWTNSGTLPVGATFVQVGQNYVLTLAKPLAAGTFTYQLNVSSGLLTGSKTITMVVENAIEITGTLASGTVGSPYSSPLTLIGDSPSSGFTGYTWTYTGTPPPGLILPYTGGKVFNITGTPSAVGTYNFTVTCRADSMFTGTTLITTSKVCSIVIGPGTNPPLPVSGLPTDNTIRCTQGQTITPVVLTSTLAGGATSLNWTYTMQSGTLPAGLSLNVVGNTYVLSGTPTAYTPSSPPMISFRVEDDRAAPHGVGGITATIIVSPDFWLSSTPPTGFVNTPYNSTGTFSTAINGGDGSGYSLVSFSGLPTGLSCEINVNTGILSLKGTPTSAGVFYGNVVINAAASGLGTTIQRRMNITITINGNAITIVPANTTLCTTASVPVRIKAKVIGGATQRFSITPSAGTLSPAGPYDSDQGTIVYTPDGTGTKTLTLISADDAGVMTDVTVNVTSSASVCSVSPTNSPSLYQGESLVVSATISNSCATVKGYWQVIGDGGAGRFSPNNQGASVTYIAPSSISSTKTITLTFFPYEQANQSYNLSVVLVEGIRSTLDISTSSPLPNGAVSSVYAPVTFAKINGPSGTATWSSSRLPTGMLLSSAGVLSGTPSEGGSFKITVTVSVVPSSGGSTVSASKVFDLTVTGGSGINFTVSPSTGSVSGGTVVTLTDVGGNFLAGDTVTLQAVDYDNGGTPPYVTITPTSITATTITFTTPTWGYNSSSFICDIGINRVVGILTRIATKARAWTWTQAGGNLSISNFSPPSVVAGQLTDQTITVTGVGFDSGCIVQFNQNNTSYVNLTTSYVSNNGSLLATLPASYFTTSHANQSATIQVYRASDGSTVLAKDGANQPRLFMVLGTALQISTTQGYMDSSPATRGDSYSLSLLAEGGVSPYSWSLNAGSELLPTGLSISSAGVIFGTVDLAADSSTPTFKVTDNAGTIATKSLRVSVVEGALSITTNSLEDARNGSSYSKQLVGSGGTPPYTWSRTAGGLPAGLNLSASGLISGTPSDTENATYTFTAHLVDATSDSVDKVLTLKLLEALSVVTVNSITPAYGSIAGGTAVTITGTGFISGCGVKFAGFSGVGLTYISPTELRCITPPGSEGFIAVSVINPDGGEGTKNNGFEYRTITAPVVTSISRQDGPFEGGQTVILYGNNFNGVSNVKFGLDPTAPGQAFDAVIVDKNILVSPQTITLTTPAYLNTDKTSKVEVNIYVTNASGVGTFASGDAGYTYRPAPVITQVLPNSGSTSGQNTVYVIGRNFFERGNSKPRVFIGNVEVSPANIVLREE